MSLGITPVEFDVTEFGVGHQRAVDEQPRADPRAEREYQHDAVDIAPRTPAHLGEPGGVRVVHHGDRPRPHASVNTASASTPSQLSSMFAAEWTTP